MKWNRGVLVTMAVVVSACAGIPTGLQPVREFELDRYLGRWYEIARLDHGFERGLSNVSADYSLREDGGVDVLNRGWDSNKKRWKEAKGKAYFVGDSGVGRLKVSFFGPFYGGYNVLELDRVNYSWALVCGPKKSYLWILARERRLEQSVLDDLLAKAKEFGFDTDALIMVEHDRADG